MGSPKSRKKPLCSSWPTSILWQEGRGTVRQCQVLWPGPSGIEICTRRPAMLTEQKTSTASSLPAMEKYLTGSFPDLNVARKGHEK